MGAFGWVFQFGSTASKNGPIDGGTRWNVLHFTSSTVQVLTKEAGVTTFLGDDVGNLGFVVR